MGLSTLRRAQTPVNVGSNGPENGPADSQVDVAGIGGLGVESDAQHGSARWG